MLTFLVTTSAFATAVFADISCPFGQGALYSDVTSTYNVSCINSTSVHLIDTSSTPMWNPVDAPLSLSSNSGTISASFSNSKTVIHGTVDLPNANNILWDNGATWTILEPQKDVTSVHLVWMTHLDLGFTDTTRNVCDEYFYDFFPAAMKTAADLRKMGGPERFRWTEISAKTAVAKAEVVTKNVSIMILNAMHLYVLHQKELKQSIL